jgi:small-conductance mechanosensitive channel
LEATRQSLVDDANALNKDIGWLSVQHSKWTNNLAQVQADPSLEELRLRIAQLIEDIERIKTLAEDRLKLNITLQTRASERDQFIARVIEKISNEKIMLQKGLFQADTNPLWDFRSRRETDQGLTRALQRNYARDFNRSREFISARRGLLLVAALTLLLTLLAALKIRRSLPAWIKAGIVKPSSVHVFKRPFSLAFFTSLLAILPLLPVGPAAIRGVISALFVVPTLRLIGPGTPAARRPLLFTLIFSTILVQFVRIIGASPALKRSLLALSTFAICCVALWLLRRTRALDQSRHHRSLIVFITRVGIVLLFASFLANALGYFALSQVLMEGCLLGTYYGVVLYTAREVTLTVLSTLLMTDSSKRLAALRGNTSVVIRWLRILLTLAVWIALIVSLLRLFTVRDVVFATVRGWLDTPLVSGTNSFTAGDVFNFLLVIAIGFLTATAFRVVLREDVLQRLPVRNGIPFAVSTIIYYLLLVFILILALIAAGVELSKFTLFTGAFGIGIGFGLQNTINNFASGLIILFEQPVKTGDRIAVGDIEGDVTRIGARSTTLLTNDNINIIIPNSKLIAENVVNWTHSARKVRFRIPVTVAFHSDVRQVEALLLEVADEIPDVLTTPAPRARFTAFGGDGLEFELRAWTTTLLHRRGELVSNVNFAIYEKFGQHNIEVPYPQRDIHIPAGIKLITPDEQTNDS